MEAFQANQTKDSDFLFKAEDLVESSEEDGEIERMLAPYKNNKEAVAS